MSLGLILLIVFVIALAGGFSGFGRGYGYGHGGMAGGEHRQVLFSPAGLRETTMSLHD